MTKQHTFSAVYRQPTGKVRADWIAYDTLGAAMLGPEQNVYVGVRLGYVKRTRVGPPQLFGCDPSTMIDLAR